MFHIIFNLHLKITMRYYHTPINMYKIQNINTTKSRQDVEQQELSFILVGNAK